MNEEVYIKVMKDQISDGIYYHLFHTHLGGDVYKPKHDLVFLDIGANIGLVSIYAVPYCKRIVAIEPNPEIFPQLVENTRNYIIIERYRTALAPINGTVEFFINDLNFTASSTVNTHGKRVEVEGMTLPRIIDYHRLEHVDVVKIDCEGCEGESLAFHELEWCKDKVDTWFIEHHNCPRTTWKYKIGQTVEKLARLGYHRMEIGDNDGMAMTATRL